MTGLVLTDEAVAPELKVVLEEQNQRVANNPRARLVRADRRRALPQSSLRQAGDRLAARDRKAQPRGRAGLLQAVLHAQQRGAGGRRRRHHRGDQDARRSDLRQGRQGRRDRPARCGRRSRRRSRPATSRWPTRRSSSRACIAPISCRRRRPPSPANPRRSKCCRSSSATAPPAGSIARSWSSARLAVGAGGWYNGTALDATQFGVYGSPKPGVTLPKLEDAIDAVIDDVVANGVTPDEVERAKNRLIADAIYAQDSQATMARWYGAALTTGSTRRSGPDLARPHPRGDRRRGERGGQGLARQAAVGDRLSHQGLAKRGKANVIQRLRISSLRIAAALIAALRRRSPRARPRCSAWFRPAASKPGWCMSRRCRWSR